MRGRATALASLVRLSIALALAALVAGPATVASAEQPGANEAGANEDSAGEASASEAPAREASEGAASETEGKSGEALPPPAPPPEPVGPRRYGDQGTSELAVGLSYGSASGLFLAAGYKYFVIDGVAPGLDLSYLSGGTDYRQYGMALAALRLVPLRTSSFALVLTGRAGRVFVADASDGWAAGGGGGVILFFGSNVGLELGYEALRLLPSSFCSANCVLHGPVVGVRVSF